MANVTVFFVVCIVYLLLLSSSWTNAMLQLAEAKTATGDIDSLLSYDDVVSAVQQEQRQSGCIGFAPNTIVHRDGNRAIFVITDIVQNDIIWSYNEQSNSSQAAVVTSVIALSESAERQRCNNEWIQLQLANGETLLSGADQPYYVHDYGWMSARQLQLQNHQLHTISGYPISINGIQLIVNNGNNFRLRSRFSFEVAECHSFYVGKSGVLVHNAYSSVLARLVKAVNSHNVRGANENSSDETKTGCNNDTHFHPDMASTTAAASGRAICDSGNRSMNHSCCVDVQPSGLSTRRVLLNTFEYTGQDNAFDEAKEIFYFADPNRPHPVIPGTTVHDRWNNLLSMAILGIPPDQLPPHAASVGSQRYAVNPEDIDAINRITASV